MWAACGSSATLSCLLSQLVENVVLLLEVLNVWDENEENVEWEEMAQVGVRILLAFISRPETEYCATASSKLSKLLKARTITAQGELCYILGRLYQAFVTSREKGTKLSDLPYHEKFSIFLKQQLRVNNVHEQSSSSVTPVQKL